MTDEHSDEEAVFDSMMAASGGEEGGADDLVRAANSIRNRLVLGGWTTDGAEDMTQLLVGHALNVRATLDFMAADSEDE